MNGKRHRSPNFPAVDLRVAVERVKILYGSDKAHAVPVTIIHDRWGYKSKSGAVDQTIGALSAYGLIEDVGGSTKKREIKVSDIGRKIALDHSETPSLLRECAVKPKVFSHLLEKYGNGELPPDSTISEYLVFHHDPPFNEASVGKCIARFKATIAYAKLDGSAILPPGEEGNEGEFDRGFADFFSKPDPKQDGVLEMKDYPIPLGAGAEAVLRIPQPMTKKMFETLKRFVELYEDVMVHEDGGDTEEE